MLAYVSKHFDVLANLFVTQKEHIAFSDKLYLYISDVKTSIMDKLDSNQESSLDRFKKIDQDIIKLETQTKALSNHQENPSISYSWLGHILLGACTFLSAMAVLLTLYFHLH